MTVPLLLLLRVLAAIAVAPVSPFLTAGSSKRSSEVPAWDSGYVKVHSNRCSHLGAPACCDLQFTNEVAVFDLLDIGLVHGWLCDPQVSMH